MTTAREIGDLSFFQFFGKFSSRAAYSRLERKCFCFLYLNTVADLGKICELLGDIFENRFLELLLLFYINLTLLVLNLLSEFGWDAPN